MLAGVMARWSEAPPKEVEKAAISILLLLLLSIIRKSNLCLIIRKRLYLFTILF
jgi:hypothetical protein